MQAGAISWWLGSGTVPWTAVGPSPVVVTSDPAGASIALDGTAIGLTPVTTALQPGTYSLVIGAGDQARTQSLEVRRGVEARVHVVLPPTSPASPVATTTGGLTISSEPAGAEVFVDGRRRGVAPITVDQLTPGVHEVTVTRAGATVRRPVDVAAGITASVIVSLTGGGIQSGWLVVTSPVAADILEDGAPVGRTSAARVLMTVGRHDLDLVNEQLGYRVRRTVQITGGQTTTLALEPVNGRLSINAQPWAEVWIDGTLAGETPLGNLSVPIGTHEVVLRHPQFGERRESVTVGVDVPARLGVDMRP